MKNTKVYWTDSAKQDLQDIIEYIAKDSIEIALKKYTAIREAAETLATHPASGRIIPELEIHNIHKYRELIIEPWRLMYKQEPYSVYVLAVIDGRRNVEDILLKRQLR